MHSNVEEWTACVAGGCAEMRAGDTAGRSHRHPKVKPTIRSGRDGQPVSFIHQLPNFFVSSGFGVKAQQRFGAGLSKQNPALILKHQLATIQCVNSHHRKRRKFPGWSVSQTLHQVLTEGQWYVEISAFKVKFAEFLPHLKYHLAQTFAAL